MFCRQGREYKPRSRYSTEWVRESRLNQERYVMDLIHEWFKIQRDLKTMRKLDGITDPRQ